MSAVINVKDCKIESGSTATGFSTTTGYVIYYAVGTFDSANGLLSNVGPIAAGATFTAPDNGATLDLQYITPDTNATHWVIYRTAEVLEYADPEFAKADLGEFKRIPIADTSTVDNFDKFTYTENPTPTYGMLTVVDPETSATLNFSKYNPPPTAASAVGNFKGHMWALTSASPRTLAYSLQGYPEYWPSVYVVEGFPLEQNDTLITGRAVSDLLILFAKEAVFSLTDFPKVQFGQLSNSRTSVLAGAPGCVGVKAVCTVDVGGVPYAAWVSPFGIYITNGTTYRRITADLDWETEVSQAALSTSVLRWDALNQIMWFNFDSTGNGANDKEMPIHLDETHSKSSGLPKLGQPTTKATSDMVSALAAGSHYRYSGHPTNGIVYYEGSGNTDAATGSNVGLTLKTGRNYVDDRIAVIGRCNLRTTDAGSGRTCTVNVTTGMDSTNNTQDIGRSIDLSGQRGKVFLVGRAGEWAEFEVVDTGAGSFGVLDVRAEIRTMDYAGKVDV